MRCFDSNPKAIRACLSQRDEVYGDDEVTICLDTFNDKKKAFAFQVVGSKSKSGTGIILAMTFNLNRAGKRLGFSLDYTHIPPDFEASLGFFLHKYIRSISTRLSYAFLPQNDLIKEIYTSILLSYEYRPGTVFYLGVDDNQERDESGIYRVTGRYYFIKFSYWWHI